MMLQKLGTISAENVMTHRTLKIGDLVQIDDPQSPEELIGIITEVDQQSRRGGSMMSIDYIVLLHGALRRCAQYTVIPLQKAG